MFARRATGYETVRTVYNDRVRPDAKRAILEAASELVQEDGASHLTLEQVAVRAGISKGGLLYHFPTKQWLIIGLVDDLIERFNVSCQNIRGGHRPGSFTRAYLRSTLADDSSAAAGIVSAIANDPALLKPLHDAYARWQEQLERDGIDPVTATIVRLVADGLWFAALIGAPPLRPVLLKRLVGRLDRIIRDGIAPERAVTKRK